LDFALEVDQRAAGEILDLPVLIPLVDR